MKVSRHARASSMIVTAVLLAPRCLVAQTPEPGKMKILYRFAGAGPNGCGPNSLILNDDGNFYGTTRGCGDKNMGTVFRMTQDGQLTVLHSFTGGTDGALPVGPLTRDGDGNIYGVTTGESTAFRVSRAGEFKSFGKLPYPPLTSPVVQPNGLFFASDGNLYGTSVRGGKPVFNTSSDGVFFSITPDGVMTVLHVFNTDTEGGPPSPLVEGSDGNLYATVNFPSALLRITTAGVVTRLPDSSPPKAEGFGGLIPPPPLVRGSDGNFYGVATTVFKIASSGAFTSLSPLQGFERPPSGLVQGGNGNFYGASRTGVFQVTPGGVFTAIYRFNQADKTCSPGFCSWLPNALIQGPDGLYGTEDYDGGSFFKITCPSCGGSSGDAGGGGGTPPPSQTAGPIEVIDPNNPALLPLFSGAVKWDQQGYDTYAKYSPLVSGLAADGVTHVAVRWRVPQAGVVTFTITDETKKSAVQVGSLGCIYSSSCAPSTLTTYMVPAEKISDGYMAFALLRAPMDFARSGVPGDAGEPLRTINVTATQAASNSTAGQAIILTRPPLVLLHGLWSDKNTWDWPVKCPPTVNPLPGCIVTDSRFIVWAQDYKGQNADHFEVNLGFVPVQGINQPREGIRIALDQLRAREIAATQVDFVGHSMGGLLGRLYAGGYKGIEYYRDDNLHAGDIHKLITLDTPHYGSELAPQLLDPAAKEESKLGFLFSKLGCMTCGAVADLRPGSEPLSNMPLAAVPSHAIVGVGGIESLASINTANSWMPLSLQLLLTNEINNAVQWDAVCSFGALTHDVIVSAPSQIGGISGDAVSFFKFDASIDNPLWWAIHFSVTKESRIAARVVELLNQPVGSALFGQFPATSPRKGVGGSCL